MLYLGAYYVMLNDVRLAIDGETGEVAYFPRYRFGFDFSPRLFEPAHTLDRLLRRGYWTVPPGKH